MVVSEKRVKFYDRQREIALLTNSKNSSASIPRSTATYSQLQDIVQRDYDVFSGFALENYFRSRLIESVSFSRFGGWWNRKGENEIDLIAENEIDKSAVFVEVKRLSSRYDESSLKAKLDAFPKAIGKFKNYKLSVKGLSLDDM